MFLHIQLPYREIEDARKAHPCKVGHEQGGGCFGYFPEIDDGEYDGDPEKDNHYEACKGRVKSKENG